MTNSNVERKPGRKTSELWLAVASGVMLIAGAVLEMLPPEYAGVGLTVVTAVYTLSRTIVKLTGR